MNITVSNLNVSYTSGRVRSAEGSSYVLHDLSFEIREGRSLGILGANGSGKSTLLKTLCGILPYEGSVLVDGKELRNMPRKQISSRISMLSQLSAVYFSYTVYETVLLGRYLHTDNLLGIPSSADKKAVNEILETTGLTSLADKQIFSLSGGQLQRVYLGRTLAQQTPILLLDEPTNHLDLKVQSELMDHLTAWKQGQTALKDGSTHENTLIAVFHDLASALRVSDDLLCLKDGRIAAYGTKKDILESPGLLQNVFDFDVLKYLREQMAYASISELK